MFHYIQTICIAYKPILVRMYFFQGEIIEQIFIALQYIRKHTFNLRAKRKKQNIPFAHFLRIRPKWRVRRNGGRRPSKWRQPTVEMAADLVSARFACFCLLVLAAHAAAILTPLCWLLRINRCRLFSNLSSKTQGRICGWALFRLLWVVRLVVGAAGCCVLLAVSLLLCLPLFAWDHATAVCFFTPRLLCLFLRYHRASVLARWWRTHLFF